MHDSLNNEAGQLVSRSSPPTTDITMALLSGLLFMFTIFISCLSDDTLTCRDADGLPVDWYYIYKLPRNTEAASPLQKQGAAYAYITSSAPDKGWTISSVGIDDFNSIPAKTLAPMYTSNNTLLRVLYNDQKPSGQVSTTRGHTKGVLLSSGTSGIWLVHSVPHYPPEASVKKYEYPNTGRHNGQSFLCISVPFEEVNKIGLQLQYNEIEVYDSFLPMQMQNLTNVKAAMEQRKVKTGKLYNIVSISTLRNSSGLQFTSYAKTAKFGKDLYSDLVAAQEEVPLVVQSWLDGPGKLPSSCQRNLRIYNLKTTALWESRPDRQIKPEFQTTVDHSKWAVAWNTTKAQPDKKLICVGDINRAEHQEVRGGGTVCLTHPDVWNSYFKSVKAYEKCPS